MSFIPEGWEVVSAPQAENEGFNPQDWEVVHVPEPESGVKSAARTIAQPALGYLSKFTYPADLLSMAATGESLAEFDELNDRLPELKKKFGSLGAPKGGQEIPDYLDKDKYLQALQTASETFPTQNNIERFIEDKTGAPLEAKTTLQKMGRLGGMSAGFQLGNAQQKLISGAIAPVVSQTAQALGVPEPIADITGLGASAIRLKQGAVKQASEKLQGVKQTYPSGLEKPKSADFKYAEQARITPERQQKLIENLDKQAEQLTRKSIEKHTPISKQIEEGFDFTGHFDKEFDKLESLAKKQDVVVDIEPISDFLESTYEKYHGIPKPHSEALKVLEEADAFSKNPQAGVYNLLKTYRSNNSKVKGIFETSRVTGKQKEYVDFLLNMNREIASSMKKSMPKESAFMKNFFDLNAEFSNYRKAVDAQRMLEPLIGGKLTPSTLENIIKNKKTQQKLKLAMGEAGSKEIIQISEDLKSAHEAIKRMSAKEFSKWEAILPIGALVGLGPLGKAYSFYKLKDYSQRALGFILTQPNTRRYYGEALQSLTNGDKASYEKAMKNMLKSLRDSKEKKNIT
jgi:hypothetical protein